MAFCVRFSGLWLVASVVKEVQSPWQLGAHLGLCFFPLCPGPDLSVFISPYPNCHIHVARVVSMGPLLHSALSPGRNILTALACVALANSGEQSDLQEATFHPCPLRATAPQHSYKATPLLSSAMDLVLAPNT